MATIIENQRRAFVTAAQDDARRLCHTLNNLSDPQRAAIIAMIAAATSTPVDIVMLGTRGDWNEARETIGGHLRTTRDNRWDLGSGCEFVVEEMPR